MRIYPKFSPIRILFCIFADGMKNILFAFSVLIWLTSCAQKTDDEKAAGLVAEIESLYQSGQYHAALDSIRILRDRFPQALEARKKSLKLWQEASLKLTQQDIARTDSALQVMLKQMQTGKYPPRMWNKMAMKRDSLRIRYDVLCATVRAIHLRQKEK